MTKVYHASGAEIEMEHSIDVRQALARDDFFEKPPTEEDIGTKKEEVKKLKVVKKISVTEKGGKKNLIRRRKTK